MQTPVKFKRNVWRDVAKCKWLYVMLAIPLVQYFLFRYAPLTGIQVAFKDYNIFKGMWDSPWAGFKYFRELFSSTQFWLALKNTVVLNLLDLLFGFPTPIILAIMLYEMRSVKLKRVYQTLMYLPHFLSWVIVGSLVVKLFGSTGMVNNLIKAMGGSTVNFLTDNTNWVIMYVATGVWQSAGWGTIIYLAAISGVNTELYEAAEVDGCGRIRRIWYVTLPCIMPTIIVMLILRLGQMVGIGFERPYVMMNDMVKNVAEVTSTFVYTNGIKNARYSFSTAVDLFGSLVNMMFVIGANAITKRMGEGGLW
ncbi:MAG: ABC transporter permease subunit [Clostridia bacterium]|nr:ABC transporter permease subunit [Clostridia bacterium]